MARIVVGSYMVRYPLGGMLSWVLQYLVGFQRLGHEVWFVEKADHHDACFDPVRGVMGDDATHGVDQVGRLLERFGLGGRWCFVDIHGRAHGAPLDVAQRALATADVFVDMGTHGAWLDDATGTGLRVLLDGEPGFTQVKWHHRLAAGESLPPYDRWFTTGANVGRPECPVPTLGVQWEHVWHPVAVDLFDLPPPPSDAPFTTVMNWRSHVPVELDGLVYGQKDVELERFATLPARVPVPLELALSGPAPRGRLEDLGWRLRSGHEVTRTFDAFVDYLAGSAGELGVCKHAFVAFGTGWFSDRSAAYLAAGRPVVLDDTGFGEHLPVGEGLFAVRTVDEAAAALETIAAHPTRHRRAARDVAREHLDTSRVLGRFLDALGVGVSRPRRSPGPDASGELAFLVLGAGRSGTSLLATCLDAHPDVTVGFERGGVDILLGGAPEWTGCSTTERVAGFLDACRSDARLAPGRWGNKITTEQLAGVAADRSGLEALFTGPLRGVPVVFVTRDGPSCVASKVRRAGITPEEATRRWRFAGSVLDVLHDLGGNVCVVRYDDLVAAPEATLAAVCEFLGARFDTTVLSGTSSEKLPAEYRREGFGRARSEPLPPELEARIALALASHGDGSPVG